MRFLLKFLILSGLLVCACPSLAGEVADASPNGFTIVGIVRIQAPPALVYKTLVEEVDRWWDPGHTFFGDPAGLSIDARPGGCFCERSAGGGGVRHLTVVFADPGKRLRMTGALGPLQKAGVAGNMSFDLGETGKGTRLSFSYAVGGYLVGGLDALAPAVNGMWTVQLQRLKRLVESGSPEPPGH